MKGAWRPAAAAALLAAVLPSIAAQAQAVSQEVAPPPPAITDLALPPPPLPEIPVVLARSDRVAAAIAARFTEPGARLPPRLAAREREAIAAFYGLGAFAPLWVGPEGWTAAGRELLAVLAGAADDGLSPAAYAVPAAGADPEAAAAADVALSAAVVLYARDARGGRIDPARLPRPMAPKLDLPHADAVLTRLAAAGPEAGRALASYQPRHPGYLALRAKLLEARVRRALGAGAPLPSERSGMRDRRVALIGAGSVPDGDRHLPSGRQVLAGLATDRAGSGADARDAVAASGRPPSPRQEADLVANMERWRWLPDDLGARYVAVNIPEFRGRVVEGGRTAYDTRVIVGRPESPTPAFTGSMEYAVVNPSWTIPPSILKNEILPRLARDPDYAARLGYEVVRRGDSITVRQPPGERNALGFIKFMFPNRHAVYLHDTPNRSLFGATRRAFSHGCVRVDQPFRLAEMLLGPAWPSERLKALIGRGERTIRLVQALPVHLTYFTAFVDEGGTLRQAEDLYGYDGPVKVALGL